MPVRARWMERAPSLSGHVIDEVAVDDLCSCRDIDQASGGPTLEAIALSAGERVGVDPEYSANVLQRDAKIGVDDEDSAPAVASTEQVVEVLIGRREGIADDDYERCVLEAVINLDPGS